MSARGAAASPLAAAAGAPPLRIRRFNPEGFGFPRPAVPVRPWLRTDQLRRSAQAPGQALADAGRVVLPFAMGRYALQAALRASGVGPGTRVLAPAYHCRSMIDGALALGAEVAFYRVTPSLGVDLDHLQQLAAQRGRPVRAVIAAHSFGFGQSLQALLAWCAAQDVRLVEDCSHVLVHPAVPTGLGLAGDFGIASPNKFFPVEDGGLLWHQPQLAVQPADRSPSPLAELRGAWHTLQRARQGQAPAMPAAAPAALGHRPAATGALAAGDSESVCATPSDHFDEALARSRGQAGARWLAAHVDAPAMAAQRRRRYQQWLQAARQWPEVEALYPALPDAVVPYMVPLFLRSRVAERFEALKYARVPVGRWDDMAVSDCPVAGRYRLSLVHLPCHQAIDDTQMDWLLQAATHAMARLG